MSVATASKRVCSWCGLLLSDGVEPISHGICDDCADAMHDKLAGRCAVTFSGNRCMFVGPHTVHQAVYSQEPGTHIRWESGQIRGYVLNAMLETFQE